MVLEYLDDEIISGILNKDDAALEYIYNKYYPMIQHLITSNSGNDEDAKDIFQEAVIVIFKKIKLGNFKLTSTFKTYLYSICKNIWLKELERRKYKFENIENIDTDIIIDDSLENIDEYITDTRKRLFQRYFATLSQDCQKVLILFLKNLSLKEIANIMGYKSDKYAKKRKYQCKEILFERIQADPKFKEGLYDESDYENL